MLFFLLSSQVFNAALDMKPLGPLDLKVHTFIPNRLINHTISRLYTSTDRNHLKFNVFKLI